MVGSCFTGSIQLTAWLPHVDFELEITLIWYQSVSSSSLPNPWLVVRDGNRAGSGWVAPIPTPLRLFETILIPVSFKELNKIGRVGMVP